MKKSCRKRSSFRKTRLVALSGSWNRHFFCPNYRVFDDLLLFLEPVRKSCINPIATAYQKLVTILFHCVMFVSVWLNFPQQRKVEIEDFWKPDSLCFHILPQNLKNVAWEEGDVYNRKVSKERVSMNFCSVINYLITLLEIIEFANHRLIFLKDMTRLYKAGLEGGGRRWISR